MAELLPHQPQISAVPFHKLTLSEVLQFPLLERLENAAGKDGERATWEIHAQPKPPSLLSCQGSNPGNRNAPNGPIPPHRQRKEMQGEIDKGAKLGCLRFKRGEDTLQCPAPALPGRKWSWISLVNLFVRKLLKGFVCPAPSLRTQI